MWQQVLNATGLAQINDDQETTRDLAAYLTDLREHGFILPKSEIDLVDDEPIGQGYFGFVLRCRHLATQEVWAVKCLETTAATSEWARAAIIQEAWAMMQVRDHSHVVSLKGLLMDGPDDPEPFLAMEYMEGGNLKDQLREIEQKGRTLGEADVRYLGLIIQQITLAVLHVTQCGMVHRDLAPRNILLDSAGNVKLGDFGHCRPLNADGYYKARDQQLDLPLRSQAPELISKNKRFTTATEVHALGVCIHEIWSLGRQPFAYLSNLDVIRLLQSRCVQLNRPKNCPPVWSAIQLL